MESYIRLRKTPRKYRGTYKIRDEQGKVICEVHPGKDGVTEVDIANAHRVDDIEVYENCKTFRPKFPDWLQADIDAWKESKHREFLEKFGREPMRNELPGYEHLLSLDEFIEQDDDGNHQNRLSEELLRQQVTEPPSVECLRELVASFPPSWQEIYQSVLIDGLPMVKVAEQRGVSEGAIRKTVNKIRARIAGDENLKKVFHEGTNFNQKIRLG